MRHPSRWSGCRRLFWGRAFQGSLDDTDKEVMVDRGEPRMPTRSVTVWEAGGGVE
jgi:hypothetical protein